MARKKGGKSKGFVSKGERPNVKSDTKRLMRNEVTLLETTLNKQKAFRKHKQHDYNFPTSQKISKKGLWIPSHPKLSKEVILKIVEVLNKFKPA